MFTCILSKLRAFTGVIIFGVVLIIAAVAVGLSVGLIQKQTKSDTTTGSYQWSCFLQGYDDIRKTYEG